MAMIFLGVLSARAAGPVLASSTYLGGSGLDYAYAVAVDGSGNVYLAGDTDSTNFPVVKAFQAAPGGGTCGSGSDVYACSDVWVMKLGPDGKVIYSTYLGGSGDDHGRGIAVDASGDVYVTGYTSSSDFPTVHPVQATYQGGNCGSATDPAPCYDVFVAELNPSGTGLIFSTYLGGSGDDLGAAIAVTKSGEAVVAGSTSSSDFPVTTGALQTTYGGGTLDAFVAEFAPSGSSLVYSTYLGGSGDDRGMAVGVDDAGNSFVAGSTDSSDFPVTNAWQATLAPGTCGSEPCTDAFVSEIASDGSLVVYSTYLGGSGGDYANSIAVDAAGNAYIAGSTTSTDFPSNAGAFQRTGGGNSVSAFVSELAAEPGPSQLIYSTYLGGLGAVSANGIALDSAGNAYLTGRVYANALPAASPVQAASGGFYDAFVSKLNAAGSALIFSSYLGGSGDESGKSIAVDAAGNAIVAGGTFSTNFPTTAGSFQAAYQGGAYDGFMARFSGLQLPLAELVPASLLFADQGVETSSDSLKLTLSNSGDAALSIAQVHVAGDFSQTNDCGSSLEAGRQCALSVVFTPSDYGPRTGSLSVQDSAAGSPQTVALAGNGVPSPVVSLNPSAISFAAQPVGTTSAPQAVTLTNAGTVTLNISAISADGDFSQSDNCGGSVPAGGRCTLNVEFSPQAPGTIAGTVNITDDAPGDPHSVIVSGEGLGPDAALAPAPVLFGSQGVATPSTARTVTLTNRGTEPLALSGFSTTGDFSATSGCPLKPATLAAGSSCTFQVVYKPTKTGTRLGTLSVSDNAAGSPQNVELSGRGVVAYALAATASTVQVSGDADSAQFIISASSGFGFTNPIALDCASATPAVCSFSSASIVPGAESTLTVTNLSALPDGSLNFHLQGSAGTQSASLPLQVLVANFSLSASQTSAGIAAGETATFDFQLNSTSSFDSSVSFTCGGAPAHSTCSVSPAKVVADGHGPYPEELKVATLGSSATLSPGAPGRSSGPRIPALPAAGWAALGLSVLVLSMIGIIRRRRVARLAMVCGLLSVLLTACGGGGTTVLPPRPRTPAGTYLITVTAQCTSLTRTLKFSLTVH